MRVLLAFLAFSFLSVVACAFHRTLAEEDLAVYERYALNELSKSVVEKWLREKSAEIDKACDELQKSKPDCLAHLRASVASLLQKSPQGQASIHKLATFYLGLDGWRRGTESEEATAPSSRLIGPISQQGYEPGLYSNTPSRSFGLLPYGLLGPANRNAYGPGLDSDATGRPFFWKPQSGPNFPDPTLRVIPDAYGLGTGMDQFGRPVQPRCAPGWAGPC